MECTIHDWRKINSHEVRCATCLLGRVEIASTGRVVYTNGECFETVASLNNALYYELIRNFLPAEYAYRVGGSTKYNDDGEEIDDRA